jgi:hypothetical protein
VPVLNLGISLERLGEPPDLIFTFVLPDPRPAASPVCDFSGRQRCILPNGATLRVAAPSGDSPLEESGFELMVPPQC